MPILDQYGNPAISRQAAKRRALNPSAAAGWGLYQTPRNTGASDFYRPRPFGNFDLCSAINPWDWQELIEYSRQLVSQLGNFGHAVTQKSIYAVGDAWLPQYLGADADWGAEAEDWLHNVWLPNCDWRGGVFNWSTNLRLSAMAWDVDGDDADLFLIDETGFPKIRKFSANQIGSGSFISGGTGDEVKGGPFDGAKISNGVICDRQGRLLGYRILLGGPANGQPSDRYLDVPANQMDLRYEPDWPGQNRGLPKLARAILDLFDTQDIDTFIKRGIKAETAIGLLQWTESGEVEPGTEIEGIPTDDDPAVNRPGLGIEKFYGGEIWRMRAALGEKIEAVNSGRPHVQTLAQLERLERRGFNALGWFYELLDPSKIGGASVRLIQDQARTSVLAKQSALRGRARREILFALGTAMQRGWVPRNNDGFDWMQWGFNLPAQLTVDAGYDEMADQDNLRLGTTTLAAICQKKGRWWEDTRTQRLAENQDLIAKARELMTTANAGAQSPEQRITLAQAIDLMQQNFSIARPDPAAMQNPAPARSNEEAK